MINTAFVKKCRKTSGHDLRVVVAFSSETEKLHPLWFTEDATITGLDTEIDFDELRMRLARTQTGLYEIGFDADEFLKGRVRLESLEVLTLLKVDDFINPNEQFQIGDSVLYVREGIRTEISGYVWEQSLSQPPTIIMYELSCGTVVPASELKSYRKL